MKLPVEYVMAKTMTIYKNTKIILNENLFRSCCSKLFNKKHMQNKYSNKNVILSAETLGELVSVVTTKRYGRYIVHNVITTSELQQAHYFTRHKFDVQFPAFLILLPLSVL